MRAWVNYHDSKIEIIEFNSVETIAILMCKQISFNAFKDEITDNLIF